MKRMFKVLGIVALATAIGFGFTGCDTGGGADLTGTPAVTVPYIAVTDANSAFEAGHTNTAGTVNLFATTGTATFTVPAGTQVTADAEADATATAEITDTTLTIAGLIAGNRTVILTLAGHQNFTITVIVSDPPPPYLEVTPAGGTEFEPGYTNTTGAVVLATIGDTATFTVPASTQVTANTEADTIATAVITAGTTLTITGVDVGERTVVLTHEDYQDFTITVIVPCPVETLIDNLPDASALAADEDLNEAILGNLIENLTAHIAGGGGQDLGYLVTPSNDVILPELHDLGVHVWFTGHDGDGRILHGAASNISEAITAPGFDINLNEAIAAGGAAAIDGAFEALDLGALLAGEVEDLKAALAGIWTDNAEAFFEAFLASIIEQITEGYCYCQS